MRISSNRIKSIKEFFKSELSAMYSLEEINSLIFIAFDHFLKLSKTEVLLGDNQTVSESELLKFNFLVKDLKKHKPIQYILGESEFYGLRFKVNSEVLIPRPETEELVDWILKDHINLKNLHVLDIGTGSGCIAISLKKNLNQASVFAYDISEKALNVARENAKLNKAEVFFEQKDILNLSSFSDQSGFDVIVSNPPYVLDSEKELMRQNVLNYEPHLALFVKDNDPFVFYKAIGLFARKFLNEKGILYFEINEKFDQQMKEVFLVLGFSHVEIKKDINGKNRMMKVMK